MNQPKTLDGIMSLDETNDVIGYSHHKEAKNGVFKGNMPNMHFTSIRGNKSVSNNTLPIYNCRLEGNAVYIPQCNLVGTATYIPQCDLQGNAVYIPQCDLSGTSAWIGNNTPQWIDQGYTTCVAPCSTFQVQRDENIYSPTYNNFRAGSLSEGYTYYGTISPTPGACNTIENWQNTGGTRCNNCVSQIEQRDMNTCSPSYNTTRWINGGSACNTTQTWVVVFGSYTCVGNNKHYIEQQNNPCAPDYGTTRTGGVAEYNSCYCIGTSPILTSQLYSVCWDCVSYTVYRNTNSCSPTYLHYYVNGEDQGTTAPAESSCNTSPNWIVVFGSYVCIGCTTYPVYKDLNICSPSYLHYQVNGTDVGTSNPSTGACNTEPNFVNDGSNTICMGYNLHQRTIDNNPCSASYGTNGVGALIEANSPSCGYVTTSFSGYASLAGSAEVCATGEYGQISIQVLGTNLCDCTKVTSLPSFVWSEMLPDDEFWLQARVAGIFKYRKFRRDGSANTATPIEACGDC